MQTPKIQTDNLHGTLSVCLCSSWTNLFKSRAASSLITQLESELHLLALSIRDRHSIRGMGEQSDSVGQSRSCSDSSTTANNVITDAVMTEYCGIPSTRWIIWCRYGLMQTLRNSAQPHSWWPAVSYKITTTVNATIPVCATYNGRSHGKHEAWAVWSCAMSISGRMQTTPLTLLESLMGLTV